MKRNLLITLIFMTICLHAGAMPVKHGPISYKQPDGTVITLSIRGDEFGHIILSEEGDLLINNNGRMEYAAFGADGIPYASGVVVDGKTHRDFKVSTIQTPEQIDAWCAKLSQKQQERIELRNDILKESKPSLSPAMISDDNSDQEGKITIDFGLIHKILPTTGEPKVLVILVDYQDVEFTYGSHDYFDRLLNEEGFSDYGSIGSVRDWMIFNSSGKFKPQFDVYGPVTLPNTRKYYGDEANYFFEQNAYKMAVHAMQQLDDEVDFSVYDNNGDGAIDNVFIIYAGSGGLDSTRVWPHSAYFSDFTSTKYYFDGLRLQQYACSCEYWEEYERPDGIATFVHEFSHVLGLPDIYGKGTGMLFSFTPGLWSILDNGVYNNEGLTPPNYSSIEKACLGWIDFLPFEEESLIELPELTGSDIAYAMPTDKKNEFYFFENRQQTGFDEFLPGHGMLVWHIDYTEEAWTRMEINNNERHQRWDLVEADDVKTEETRDGDSFPGAAGVTEFGFRTSPRLAGWTGKQLEFDLTDIRESEEGVISFRIVKPENNTGDPGSVIDIDANDNCSGRMYDVYGREIVRPYPGQIYIQDGKKHVK